MKKVMLTLDEGLKEDEIIIYRDGKLLCVNIHELLPEIKDMLGDISKLKDDLVSLAKVVKEK